MSFPTDFDSAAVRQVIAYVTGSDRDLGRFSLALWELAGFGLGKYLNDPKFLASVTLEDAALVAGLNIDREKLRELVEKYGPAVARLLLKLFLKV